MNNMNFIDRIDNLMVAVRLFGYEVENIVPESTFGSSQNDWFDFIVLNKKKETEVFIGKILKSDESLTLDSGLPVLKSHLKLFPHIPYGILTDGTILKIYINSHEFPLIFSMNINDIKKSDSLFMQRFKNKECDELVFTKQFSDLFQDYFKVYPNDFRARELLLNSLYVIYRKPCHSENIIYEILININRIITGKKECRPIIQNFILNALPKETIKSVDIAQYFLTDYLNPNSSLFEKLSDFRAFSTILERKYETPN